MHARAYLRFLDGTSAAGRNTILWSRIGKEAAHGPGDSAWGSGSRGLCPGFLTISGRGRVLVGAGILLGAGSSS